LIFISRKFAKKSTGNNINYLPKIFYKICRDFMLKIVLKTIMNTFYEKYFIIKFANSFCKKSDLPFSKHN